jgi:hypothetical protein
VRYAFEPGSLQGVDLVENPFGIDALLTLDPAVRAGDPLMLFVCFPLAVLSIVLRFRRGSPMERAQMKWFASAALFATTFLALSSAGTEPIADIGWILGIVGVALIPVSIAVALLRYRLYEIDRIISRTIAWAVVSTILVGGLAVGIVALQAVLSGVTHGETVAVAASTLVAFGAAQPLLHWVQARVDRRFNRAHYDAQRTVGAFGERLRDEIAMDSVARQLARDDRPRRSTDGACAVASLRGAMTSGLRRRRRALVTLPERPRSIMSGMAAVRPALAHPGRPGAAGEPRAR